MPPHATTSHEYTQHAAAAPGLQYRHAPAAPPPHVGQRERQQAQPPAAPSTGSAMTGNSGGSASAEQGGVRVGNYIIREEIGKGSFATVYRGERMTTTPPTPVAVKAVTRNKLTTKLLENLDSEIRLLKGIKQRNVVELIECMKTSSHIYLVMAFCASGDLSQHIRAAASSKTPRPANEKYPPRKEGGLHEKVVRCFLGQLAEALKFLRDKDIIHRDIKPQNLLLHPASESDIAAGHPEGIPLLQVADFGFARALPSTSLAETLCGSPLYMAPEILQYQKYDAKADLWSVGAVLYECCTGRPPFRAGNHVELLRKIEKGEDKIRFPDEVRSEDGTYAVKDPISDDIKALIRGLLKQRPQERMPYEEFFRRTDEIARWGEGSLVAPGTIRQPSTSGSRVPSRQGSHRDVAKQQSVDRGSALESRDSQEQKARETAPVAQATQQHKRGTSGTASPVHRPGSVSPTVTTLAAAMALATPSIPSTAAEQEPAFARLPPAVTPAVSSARATPSPAPGYFTSMPGEPGLATPSGATPGPSTPGPASGSALPPLQQRKGFTPRYVVGGGSSADGKQQQQPKEIVEVRTKDFAVVTTAATPTHASPVRRGSLPPSRELSRRGSTVGEDAQQPSARPAMPQQQKSGISLALPRSEGSGGSSQIKSLQQDLGASGMIGDDDSVLGREYVVVEKRNVEVNALADEMAAQPQRPSTLSHRNSRGFLSRQLSTYPPTSPAAGASPSPPSPALPYPPTPHSGTAANAWEHPPFATRPAYGTSPRSRGLSSYMYGSSPGRYGALAAGAPAATATATAALAIVGSGGTAIAKALNMASLKLFGSPSENIWLRKIGHRKPIQRHSSGSSAGETPLTVEEDNLLSDLEDIAQKATVIFDFADSKLVLMTSLMVSRGGADGAGTPAAIMQASYASPFFANAQQQARTARTSSFSSDRSAVSPLVPGSATSPVLNQQQQVTSQAGTGKTDSVRKPELLPGETLVLYLKALAFLQKGIELARDYWSSKPADRPTSADLNEYVQWFRSRFNECFEKAEWAKGLLPGDVPDSAMLAERLVFDRALEMSRAAAVSELKNENSAECEIAYDTALWMLYAILDEVMQEGEPVGDEDKVHVQKFVNSIKGRLEALRRKMQAA